VRGSEFVSLTVTDDRRKTADIKGFLVKVLILDKIFSVGLFEKKNLTIMAAGLFWRVQ